MKRRLISWLLVLAMLTSFLVSVPAVADETEGEEPEITDTLPEENPEAGEGPEEPAGEETPGEPGDEKTAETSEEPEEPAEPEKPIEPEEPEEPEKPGDPAPEQETEKPADPTAKPETEKPADPTPKPETEKPADPTPKPETEKPADPTPKTETEKPADPTPKPKKAADPTDTTATEKPSEKEEKPEQPAKVTVKSRRTAGTVTQTNLPAPESVTATVMYDYYREYATVNICWNADRIAEQTGFRVYKSTDFGEYVFVGEENYGTEWTDDDVQPMHDYSYAVCGYYDDGETSVEGARTVSSGVRPVYAFPTFYDVRCDACSNRIGISGMVNWDAEGIRTDGFLRVRRSVNGGEYETLMPTDTENQPIYCGYEDPPFYDDNDIEAGNTYQYKLDFYMAAGGTTYYGETFTTDPVELIPSTDATLTVNTGYEENTGELEVSVLTMPADGAIIGPTGLRIRRRIDGGEWTEVGTITENFCRGYAYFTEQLSVYGVYEYDVTAYATVDGQTTYGTPAAGAPLTVMPGAPKDFTGTLDNGQVSLSWTQVSLTNVSRLDIYRSVNGGEPEFLTTRPYTLTKYTDKNPAYGRNVYTLTAVITQGDDEIISEAATCTVDRKPSTPTGFSVSEAENASASVTWNAVEGASGYRLSYGYRTNTYSAYYYGVTASYLDGFQVGELSADTLSYVINNIPRGKYCYAQIESYTEIGGGARIYSGKTYDYCLINLIQLETPVLTVTPCDGYNLLQWTGVENTYRYQVYYKDGGIAGWNTDYLLPGNITQFEDDDLTEGVMRAYKIKAMAASGSDYKDSVESDVVWAVTDYTMPDDFSLTVQADGSLMASVTSTDDAAQYVLKIGNYSYFLTADAGETASLEITEPDMVGEKTFALDMQVINGDGDWYTVGSSNAVTLTRNPQKPSKPSYSASSITSISGSVSDASNGYCSEAMTYEWLLDGQVIQTSGSSKRYSVNNASADLNDLTLECGSSHSLTVRAVYTDETGRTFTSPESDSTDFSVPTLPDPVQIYTEGDNVWFKWDKQDNLSYRIVYKGPNDEQRPYSYSDWQSTDEQTVFVIYPSRPDAYGAGTVYAIFEGYILSSYVEMGCSKSYDFVVGPRMPTIGQAILEGGQAVLNLSGISYATGVEVEHNGVLLDTVPAIEENSSNSQSIQVPVSLVYGEDNVFRARAYYTDPTSGETIYGAWSEKTIYVPELPSDVRITRVDDWYNSNYAYYDLTFTPDAQAWYSISSNFPKDPESTGSNECYSHSGTDETKKSYYIYAKLPDHLGWNTYAITVRNTSSSYNASFIGYLDPVEFSIGPNKPDIGAVTLDSGKATLAVSKVEHADGLEVTQGGELLNTVPAVEDGTTSYTVPVTLTQGKNTTFRVRSVYTDPDTMEEHYSTWTEKKIYIPKMPTGVKVTRTGNKYSLAFSGDAKSWYTLSYLRPGTKEYTSYSSYGYQVAASNTTELSVSRPGHIGANKLKIRITNDRYASSASFIGYVSPVSFSVGPYMPNYIYVNSINNVNGKANLTVESYSNDEVDPCYIQLFLNGTLVKTITRSQNKYSYETTVSFDGLEGKAIQLKARTYTVKGSTKYYSDYLVYNYVGQPQNVQLIPWGLGVKVTWDPGYGATNYDAYIRTYVNNKEKIYVKKLNAKSGVLLASNKLPVKNSLRVDIISWVKADGVRYEREWNTWHNFNPRRPEVTISNTKTSITLKWPKMKGIDGFEVQRSVNSSTGYRKIGSYLKGTASSYTDKTVKSGRYYYYRVRAYCLNSSGKKVYSEFSWTVGTGIDSPTAPRITVSHSMKAIELEWKAVTCDGYKVYRYSDTEETKCIATLPKTATGYINKTTGNNKVKANKQYYYYVTAYFKVKTEYGTEYNQSWSNTVSDSLRPDTPTGVKVKKKNSTSATVSWKKVKDAKKYEVWMRTNDPQGKLKKVAVVTGTSTVVTGLKSGNIYYFVVRAISGKAVGDYCENEILRMK